MYFLLYVVHSNYVLLYFSILATNEMSVTVLLAKLNITQNFLTLQYVCQEYITIILSLSANKHMFPALPIRAGC